MSEVSKNLFVVVHHQQDSNQPWINSWIDDNRLDAITTTIEIGRLCEDLKKNSELIFVHRCGYGEMRPSICCSAWVIEVAQIDRKTSLVKFGKQNALNSLPAFSPHSGQNFYFA